MILSPRLLKIAQMVEFKTAADIGTDHAKLPVYLVEKGVCNHVIASDVANGPVLACKKTVTESGFEEFINVRKGDGLSSLSAGEADTVIIAGMGGDLISEILGKGIDIAVGTKEIILQPMTHVPQLRRFLHDNNFAIADEILVCEKEKIYVIIKVTNGVNQYCDEFDYVLSPILLKKRDPLLKAYLKKLIKKYSAELQGLKKASIYDEKSIVSTSVIVDKLEKIYETTEDY